MSEQASKGSLKNIGIIIAALGAVGLLIWSWNANMSLSPVKLGYYCLSCKKTEDEILNGNDKDKRTIKNLYLTCDVEFI